MGCDIVGPVVVDFVLEVVALVVGVVVMDVALVVVVVFGVTGTKTVVMFVTVFEGSDDIVDGSVDTGSEYIGCTMLVFVLLGFIGTMGVTGTNGVEFVLVGMPEAWGLLLEVLPHVLLALAASTIPTIKPINAKHPKIPNKAAGHDDFYYIVECGGGFDNTDCFCP